MKKPRNHLFSSNILLKTGRWQSKLNCIWNKKWNYIFLVYPLRILKFYLLTKQIRRSSDMALVLQTRSQRKKTQGTRLLTVMDVNIGKYMKSTSSYHKRNINAEYNWRKALQLRSLSLGFPSNSVKPEVLGSLYNA